MVESGRDTETRPRGELADVPRTCAGTVTAASLVTAKNWGMAT